MNLVVEKTTHIGLGHAAHPDAFQGGREAAQMAKNQLPDGELDLVLAFGPGTLKFKDFIEGVRLVTGEDALVGIPASQIRSTEQSSPDSCYVLIIRSSSMRFSIAGAECPQNGVIAGTTSLSTQFRNARGNAVKEFKNHGLLLFQNSVTASKKPPVHQIGADMGLETWIAGGTPILEKSIPLICRNTGIQNGLVGIECLSQTPWGMGSVGTGPFRNQADVYHEAAKSAMREALAQMRGHPPAFGLIFFDLSHEADTDKPGAALDGSSQIVPNTPVICIPTQRRYIRSLNQALKMEKESVVALLVPS